MPTCGCPQLDYRAIASSVDISTIKLDLFNINTLFLYILIDNLFLTFYTNSKLLHIALGCNLLNQCHSNFSLWLIDKLQQTATFKKNIDEYQ